MFADWFRLKEGTFLSMGKSPGVAVPLLDPCICFCDLKINILKAVSQLVSQSAIFQ